jgi:serine/threonine-protein kinase RsbW
MSLVAQRLPDRPSGDAHYRLVVPTDIALLAEAIEVLLTCCLAHGAIEPSNGFRLRTVAAEAIANAMIYGNGNDPSLEVIIELQLLADRLVLAVTDQGEGFDPATVPDLVTEEECHDATRGRGLFMMRHLAEQVLFNEQGNAIWVTLTRS